MTRALISISILFYSCAMMSCAPINLFTTKNQEKMFTADQIKAAHSQVKSGADFPAYIKEIKAMGVTHYDCYVADGHINYFGTNGHSANVPAKYDALPISDVFQAEEFTSELKAHQLGKTDFPTFIRRCAELGVEKWSISMKNMTCTYYDKNGNAVLTEQIPN